MNLKMQLSRTLFLCLLFAIGFGFVAILVGEHKIARFDNYFISLIQGLESPGLTAVMKFFTAIGSTPVVAILAVIVLYVLYRVLHHRRELILFLSVIVGSAVINQAFKSLFHRARPTAHRLIDETGYSFPSGHSMEAFAFYGIIVFLLWRHVSSPFARCLLILFGVFMTLAIGVSRIYLGVHYPSDIVGGFLASGIWLTAAIWIYQRAQERRYQQAATRA